MTIAHIAAQNGDVEELERIKAVQPELLEQVDEKGRTIAHVGVGHVAVLQWIQKNCSNLFLGVDKKGNGIIHHAIKRSSIAIFDWIEENRYYLLGFYHNKSLACHVVVYGRVELLNWFFRHHPELITERTMWQRNIGHVASFYKQIGILDWILYNQPELLTKIDYQGLTIAHVAAIHGVTEVLDWINKNKSDLLLARDRSGFSIAHSAAFFAMLPTLDWLKDNRPELIDSLNLNHETIAHYAAESGNPAALQWVENNAKFLLEEKDQDGRTIVHYAIFSKQPRALNWVMKYYPALIKRRDNDQRPLEYYIFLRSNQVMCNYFLMCSRHPHYINVPVLIKNDMLTKELVYKFLDKLLDENYFLTKVRFAKAKFLSLTLPEKITQKLERNQIFKKSCLTFLHGQFDAQCQKYHLPNEILYRIFKYTLPKSTPEKSVRKFLNHTLSSVAPRARLIRRINQQLSTEKQEQSEGMLKLKESLLTDQVSPLPELINNWQAEYTLAENSLFNFFKTRKMKKFIKDINQISGTRRLGRELT